MIYNDYIKNLIKSLPNLPGVYQYFDKNDKIIYIGKAKNLKKRVSSYFTKNFNTFKTKVLVNNIADIKHIIVETETDAFLLENNLIKKYQPKYNILLKDDKSFPWICITNEEFPRIYATRNLIKSKGIYYGPYTSISMMRTLLLFLKELFPLRSCKLNLSQESIENNTHKVCLEYHIKKCFAPCVGKQSKADYLEFVKQIKYILSGNISKVKLYLNNLMYSYSESLEFEKALDIKNKISLLNNYQSKSTIFNPKFNNIDIYSYIDDIKNVYINYIRVLEGRIVQSRNYEIIRKLDESIEEIIKHVIFDNLNKFEGNSFLPAEILSPIDLSLSYKNIRISIPKIGDKKKLMDFSLKNAKYFRLQKIKHRAEIQSKSNNTIILSTLQKDLHLQSLPFHIECFDNSNIQGTNPVASCVVFKNAKPSKRDYRYFKIKTVNGPNDFASMSEIIFRRYNRLLKENKDIPQLIIVDGGKGQLSSAVKSLKELHLYGKIAIIGIAKKLEEIYFPYDSIPLYLDKNSSSLKLIQQLRNEAHRFGINFHRSLRSNQMLHSELDDIKGIGKQTQIKLFQEFKSIENIKKLSLSELSKCIGKAKAKIIQNYFSN